MPGGGGHGGGGGGGRGGGGGGGFSGGGSHVASFGGSSFGGGRGASPGSFGGARPASPTFGQGFTVNRGASYGATPGSFSGGKAGSNINGLGGIGRSSGVPHIDGSSRYGGVSLGHAATQGHSNQPTDHNHAGDVANRNRGFIGSGSRGRWGGNGGWGNWWSGFYPWYWGYPYDSWWCLMYPESCAPFTGPATILDTIDTVNSGLATGEISNFPDRVTMPQEFEVSTQLSPANTAMASTPTQPLIITTNGGIGSLEIITMLMIIFIVAYLFLTRK